VTSIPGVLAPEDAARMLLILIAVLVDVALDNSELIPETELIASTCFLGGSTNRVPASDFESLTRKHEVREGNFLYQRKD
jgi:hypothetical protein